ncbi:MAG: MOSC domain-containing protein [Rhodospirillaceae bacterium]
MPYSETPSRVVTGRLSGIATRPAKRAAMVVASAAEILANAGVSGDFGRKRGKRQVTVLSAQAWRDACDTLGAALPWTMRRANLFVDGVPLSPQAGARLVIGGVILEVTGETDPCKRMDAQHMGLTRALTPQARGGVTCRVIAAGKIAVGDEVRWQPAVAGKEKQPDLFAGLNEQRVAS